VVISIDGLPPGTYTTPGGPAVPTLRRLAAEGAYASGVVGVFPSVTYPSHTAMMTGLRPHRHGIYNNRILDPEDRSNAGWYWYARGVKAPTLPGAVRARGLRAAAVSWPVTVGADLDFLVPEFARSEHPETLTLLSALSKPSTLLDDVEAARGEPLPWPLSDRERTEMAAWIIRIHRPHLLLLHIFDTDSAQHDHGPGSPQAIEAIEAADRYVARVLEAIDAAGLRARTNVVVVSDHGFLPVTERLQLNARFKQEGWIETDARGRITRWDVYFQASGGSGFIFLEDPANTDLRAKVRAVVEAVAADPANGVQQVLLEEDLRELGADPRASFAVDMRAGFYTGYGHDALLAPTPSKGGHGFHPERSELHASLIMAGPQVPPAGDLGVVRMTQLAPTLASWFGVGLAPDADVPLKLADRR
jgi:arylsulfatase A-like enzyme